MKTETYNGWTNYETWNAALWLGNEEGSYDYCVETAQECYDNAEAKAPFTREENATFALADRLKEFFEDSEELPTSGWRADAINSYLSEVNWDEIAKHYIDDDVEKESEAAH